MPGNRRAPESLGSPAPSVTEPAWAPEGHVLIGLVWLPVRLGDGEPYQNLCQVGSAMGKPVQPLPMGRASLIKTVPLFPQLNFPPSP